MENIVLKRYIFKNLKKKVAYLAGIIFISVILCAIFSFPVGAEALSADFDGASQAFAEALKEGKSSVSVARYNIPKDKAGFLMQYSQSRNTDVFWYPSSIRYTFFEEDNCVSEIEWDNIFDDFSEIEAMRKEFEKYAKEAVNVCFGRDMTDFEKILSAHDYITETANYVLSDDYSFTAYSVFVRGEGVCQGYSYAFKYLMDAAGIECHYVSSNTLDHGWNIVKLDGEYYHVDVTSDDAVATYNGVEIRHGREYHTKLLCSDEAFACAADDVEIWSLISLPECDSTLYDDAFYKNVRGSMEFVDGSWYYVEPNEYINGSRRILKTTGETTEVFLEMEKPVYSVVSHGNDLYCAVKDIVYKVSLAGECEEFCSTVGEIFGCAIYENNIYYGVYRKKSYAVCSKILPKNLDCIEGINLDVTSDSFTLNVYIKDLIELENGNVEYSFGEKTVSVSMTDISENNLISIPLDISQFDHSIVFTVCCDGEEMKYTVSVSDYLKKVSEAKQDEKTLNVVNTLLEYAGMNEPSGDFGDLSSFKIDVSDSSDEISFIGTEVVFDGKVSVKIKFSVLGKAEFRSNGKIKVEKDGLYYTVSVLDISMYHLDEKFKIATDGVSVTFSVLSLIENCAEETKKDILTFYNYGKALDEYSK